MYAVEMRGITKQFKNVLANSNVDLLVQRGEIHSLLGENGAGKSTLMNILYGMYAPTSGEISVQGKPVKIENPLKAIELGIAMVHQHFMLIEPMTVAENVVLGYEPKKRGCFDFKKAVVGRGGPGQGIRPVRRRAGKGGEPLRRHQAARGDPQGPLPQGGDPHPGRAHGRAHAAGGHGPVQGAAPAQGERQDHPHHHPQAQGDPGPGRHGDHPAQRPGHHLRLHQGRGREQARRAHGGAHRLLPGGEERGARASTRSSWPCAAPRSSRRSGTRSTA